MSTHGDVVIRPATQDDVAAMEAIAAAAEVGPVVPDPDTPGFAPGTQAAYFSHLVDRGTVAIADAVGTVLGFGASVRTGRALHLADLFVRPDRQGQGLGHRLLDAVLGDERPLTTFASDDPRALPLYVRAGMTAYWPNLYLAGDARRLPAADPTLRVTPATLTEMAELEARWAGVDRRPELDYWATLSGGQAAIAWRGDQPVGTAFRRDRHSGHGRWVDHAVVAPDEPGTPVLFALLRHGLDGAPTGGACVPGPSGLVRFLLDAGFTIRDRDTFLASDASVVDAEREIVNTGFL